LIQLLINVTSFFYRKFKLFFQEVEFIIQFGIKIDTEEEMEIFS